MTRDEAVQKLATVGRLSIAHAEDLYDSFFEKPVVPDFIAEWIEEAKNKQGYNVVGAVNNAPSGDVENWLILENVDIFTKAWVYGYEVESEKEYVIKLKNSPQILLYEEKDEEYYFAEHCGIFSRESHTRKELEDAGFEWIFSCEGVEVTEVTDEQSNK